MPKCKKEYARHGNHYNAGEDYDISKEQVEADEKYFGEDLWGGSKSDSANDDKKEEKKDDAKKK